MKTSTYFVKYEEEENEVQVLMELTKEEGVVEVFAVEKKMGIWKIALQWITASEKRKSKKLLKEGKHQDGYSAHLKKERQTT